MAVSEIEPLNPLISESEICPVGRGNTKGNPINVLPLYMYMYVYCTVSYAQGQTLVAYQREGCHTCIFTCLPHLQPYSCTHAVSQQMSLVIHLVM